MKVYLVIDGDYGVVGIFDSPDEAKRWINKSSFRYSPRIEEHDFFTYGSGYPKPYDYKRAHDV